MFLKRPGSYSVIACDRVSDLDRRQLNRIILAILAFFSLILRQIWKGAAYILVLKVYGLVAAHVWLRFVLIRAAVYHGFVIILKQPRALIAFHDTLSIFWVQRLGAFRCSFGAVRVTTADVIALVGVLYPLLLQLQKHHLLVLYDLLLIDDDSIVAHILLFEEFGVLWLRGRNRIGFLHGLVMNTVVFLCVVLYR